MSDHIARQDNLHVFPGKRYSLFAGSEKIQHGVQENERDDSVNDSNNRIKCYSITQSYLCCLNVFLTKFDRDQGRGAHTN